MEWLTYLLKVSACSGLFYIFYHFCLQRLTFFNVNRIYLLSTLAISFVIPALQLQVERSADERSQAREVTAVYTGTFTDLPAPGVAIQTSAPPKDEWLSAIEWPQVLFVSYWLIAFVMLSISASQALQLLKHTRQINQKIGRLRVVFKQEGFTNCSFLNYVFLNREELSDEEMAVILHHENVHISRYHSADKMIIAVCKALLWFNPVIYLYEKALAQVHEYEADRETSVAIGSTSYASMLLAIAVKKNNPSLTHSFVRNPLKGRIKMLFSNPSKNMKKLTYLAALPIGLALIWTFAVQIVYANILEPTAKQRPEQIQIKSVQAEKAPLKAAVPGNEIKDKKPTTTTALPDTLWMIDDVSPGKYSEVIIDGKSYEIDILTKISPRIISTTRGAGGKLEITTHHNKIEYATQIDRENVMVRRKALASGKIYVRYPQKNQDGSRYEWINIKVPGGGGGGVSLDRGKKLLLIYEGKQYSERKFKALTADQLRNRVQSFSSFGRDTENEEIKAKYGKGYGSMIEIFKPEVTETSLFRSPGNVSDANVKVSYSAKDSVVFDKDKKFVTLYGEVKLVQAKLNIIADTLKYDDASKIVYAKNVSFTSELWKNPVAGKFMKFNLKDGSYQILTDIPWF
ncbi:M56 family metallopeptidase [Pedobacter ginsengisoli]|uniref:M56 family metallopeptidase n=1 Tax=Pedobacter ginsengisoli TaxID=363852 RepID=UPI00254A7B12|nr:M56 family metallopeptidase [Pedobacter ginsengisoli]